MLAEETKNVVLVAEDDDDHYFLIHNAFKGSRLQEDLYRVTDGIELMEYLSHRGKFRETNLYPKPLMIILDLNLPKKDGREVLQEIKASPELKKIPVAILTTSTNEEDRLNSYHWGAKHYIKKPILFKEYVDIINQLKQSWSSNGH